MPNVNASHVPHNYFSAQNLKKILKYNKENIEYLQIAHMRFEHGRFSANNDFHFSMFPHRSTHLDYSMVLFAIFEP